MVHCPKGPWSPLLLPCMLVLAALLAACGPLTSANKLGGPQDSDASPANVKPAERVIKIGFITPLTGTLAGHGARQRIAVQLAVGDVNNDGGINGSPLAVVMMDDAANPREDTPLVLRLTTEDEVMAILGPLTNAGFQTAALLADELRVPLATVGSSQSGSADQDRPWGFRFGLLDSVATSKAIASFRKLYPSVKRMVIAGDVQESDSGYMVKNIYPSALREAGLEIVDTVYLETGTSDVSAVIAKIRGLNPEGIALSAQAPQAVALARELQRQRVRVPVVASLQNWGGPEIGLAGDAVEGWVAAGAFDEDTQDPRGRAYLERFGKMGEADPAVGKPARPGPWAQTYDAVMALAQVMRQAQVTPETDISQARMAILAGLRDLRGFKGITGDISMLPNGDIAAPSLSFVARGGKWVLLR